MKKLLRQRASSAIEFITLIVFIVSALFIFRNYIVRGFSGRWKGVGDSFGHGKQYDPRGFGADGEGGGTLECIYVRLRNPNTGAEFEGWIDENCFETCDCTLDPLDPAYPTDCLGCASGCATSYCDD